jgi:regulation of enolase protein 1 (concanavalin A-like superfamily)
MSRFGLIAILSVGLMFGSARADETKSQTIKGWGTVIDPDRDCRFAEDQGKLTITIPGTYHDLTHSQGRDQLNSPRVLQEAKGDFVAQVKVHAFPLPVAGTSTSNGVCFVSSGLLIWLDGDNFIRLDRAAIADLPTPAVLVEFYEKGKQTVQAFKEIEDKNINLRIARKGGKLTFAASEDGERWDEIHTSEIPLRETVNVGILAINTTTKEFAPQLSGLKVGK